MTDWKPEEDEASILLSGEEIYTKCIDFKPDCSDTKTRHWGKIEIHGDSSEEVESLAISISDFLNSKK